MESQPSSRAGAPASVSAAQRRVLEVIKRQGSVSSGTIAERLDMTAVSAREHLSALEANGFVTHESAEPVGRGRPAILWSLTTRGESIFPDRHAELTVGLIRAMRDAVGEDGVQRIIEARARDEQNRYASQMPAPSASLRKKVEALAALRTHDGYMAEVVQEKPGQYLLIENHCPICDAAKCCAGFCSAELDFFREVLGRDVRLERIEHQLNESDRRCVYRVRADT